MIGKGELDTYHREYYPLVKKVLEEWEVSGKDRLFHGATAAIIVGSKPGGSCPAEDALFATQNILLAAHGIRPWVMPHRIRRFRPEGITGDQAFDRHSRR